MSDSHLPETSTGEDRTTFGFGRREFLKRLGGGIVVLFTTGPAFFARIKRPDGVVEAPPADFNAYLRIGADGRVTCFVGKIEMGQGVQTSLAQMLADELDVALDVVDMVMGDTDLCPYDRGTWGSLTTRVFGPELRAAGAQARAVLLELAGEQLGIPASSLEVHEGIVYDRKNPKRQVSYAALAQGREIAREVTREIAVKAVSDFQVMGKPTVRRDGRAKVTGAARYAGDIRVPGMMAARILRPPAHGAVLLKLDASAAQAMDGVEVVRVGDLVAVLHPRRDVADEVLGKIVANFDRPDAAVDDDSIFDHLVSGASAPNTISQKGSVDEGFGSASQLSQARYLQGYVAHAPMEPHVALAQMKDGRMTVWASTQTPFGVRDEVARALAMSNDRVHVIAPFVGGGFGGKSANLQAVQAARLAHHTGKPVQVFWSREDEFFYDAFQPAAVIDIRSGLTEAGTIAFWDYHVYSAGPRASETLYDVPHYRTRSSRAGQTPSEGHPFATGPWRAPGANTNVFARESQIDVLASMAGVDPLAFRLRNLSDEKMKGVLRAASERFGWRAGKAPSGRGFGVACGIDSDTYVAAMARVGVDRTTGRVQVRRIVCAQDMGLVINPEGARMQMEGCLTMGLGYCLTEELHFQGGAIRDLNFGTYQLPQFSWLPEIETVLVDSGDTTAHGGGEPAIVIMGAVIANAVFDATGARLYRLPMTPSRVLEAIAGN